MKTIKIPDDLHRQLKIDAAKKGVSLTQHILTGLSFTKLINYETPKNSAEKKIEEKDLVSKPHAKISDQSLAEEFHPVPK